MAETQTKNPFAELQQKIVEKAMKDEAYRQQFVADPMAVVEKEAGKSLPKGFKIKVIEDTPATLYIHIPPKAGAELSDDELESVAGGKGNDFSTRSHSVHTIDHGVNVANNAVAGYGMMGVHDAEFWLTH